MVTDQQVQRLRRLDLQGVPKERAAAKAGLDAKTARKYRRLGKLPSEMRRMNRDYRTRPDPFDEVWPQLEEQLRLNPGLEAKTLFDDLQRRFPGRFADGQLRTLQRHVKQWRALHGPAKEVFFTQVHHPGRLCASDFTHCTDLRVTINGVPFDHLIYHFVLTYSNWETGTICFAESFESLSEGLQNALGELGGVPQLHRTDRLTAAIPPGTEGSAFFTARYQALLRHYDLAGPGHPGGPRQRERRRRAEPSAVQACVGPGVAAAWQPRLREPRRLRRVPEAVVRAAQRGPADSDWSRSCRAACVAGTASGGVQARAGARGQRQHDPRRAATPTRWRAG